MQDSEQIVQPKMAPEEAVAAPIVDEPKKELLLGERWPTTPEFCDEATRDEAIAVAASEIFDVQQGIVKAIIRSHNSLLPTGVKMVFDKKLRSAVAQLYAGIPNMVVQQVESVVMCEQLGGPEKVEQMMAEAKAEADALHGADPKGSSEAGVETAPSTDTAAVVAGASPAGSTITELPKPLEQIAVQLDANGVMRLAPKAERPLAKVLPFKRPDTDPDSPPPSGTPSIAQAA